MTEGVCGGGPQFSPSVIPDIFNRESKGFPGGHTNERTEEKDTGFPLKTAGMTGGVGGNDKRGMRGRTIPLLSFPTFSIGNPGTFQVEASGTPEFESVGHVCSHGANGREQSAERRHDDAEQDAPRGD